MLASTRDIIVNMVIGQHDATWKCSPAERKECLNHLTHVLVNDATLQHHIDFLEKLHVDQRVATAPVLDRVVKNGLDTLSDIELSRLCVDRRALLTIYRWVDREMPPAWHEAIKRENLKKVPRRAKK